MLNSVSSIKIAALPNYKFKNPEQEIKTTNTESPEAKLVCPNAALQKAYFVPSFSGSVREVDFSQTQKMLDDTVKNAMEIAKNADIIFVDSQTSNFPKSLKGIKVGCGPDRWEIAEEGNDSYLEITSDSGDANGIKLYESKQKKLLEAVEQHPLMESVEKLGIKQNGLDGFVDELAKQTNSTEKEPLHWDEAKDENDKEYFRCVYKNHRIYLKGNVAEGYQLGIAEIKIGRRTAPPVMVFDNVVEEVALELESAIHKSAFTPYAESKEAKNADIHYIQELGFANLKTQKGQRELTEWLLKNGFQRQVKF